MKNFTFTKNITCTDSTVCSNNMITKLELKFGRKFKVVNKEQSQAISIHHIDGAHNITTHFFDGTERGITGVNIKKAPNIPTRKQLEDAL